MRMYTYYSPRCNLVGLQNDDPLTFFDKSPALDERRLNKIGEEI